MRRKKEIATIILGLLAALIIVIGQANYYSAQAKAIAETEDSEKAPIEKESNTQLKIFSNDAVSTGFQFSVNQVLHFISNIYSEVFEQIWVRITTVPDPTEYFEVLFQRIISPNAP